MAHISEKLRASAKGQDCTFEIVGVCTHNPEQTVLCHIRDESKGIGNKSADYSAAFGCYACHETIDQHRLSREDELFYSMRAMQRTWDIWVKDKLIVIPGDPDKPKKRHRKPAKFGSRKLRSNPTIPSRPLTSTRAALRGERP